MLKIPPRTLADWTPDEGEVEAWLARWEADGWVPEYPWGGSEILVDGRPIVRWAMIAMTPALHS